MALPPLFGLGCIARALWLEFRERWVATEGTLRVPSTFELSTATRNLLLLGVVCLWVPITYFPHSNIPILLPTVRAERFWYLPVIGTALLCGWLLNLLWERRGREARSLCWGVTIAFLGFQGLQARLHALDYRNDLVFWEATARAVPNSAKAHLNYGVMLGARQRLDLRLVENKKAMELAPKWPMAHIYYADTLCRLHRPDEAWPHYKDGFLIGTNQQALIALALQCLWDEKAIDRHEEELRKLADDAKGSWLAYLVNDILTNGEKHNGVDPQYRPRSYNGGPREKKTESSAEASGSAQATATQTGTATKSKAGRERAASAETPPGTVSVTTATTGPRR
jgi:hypothetical protein